MSLSLRDVSVAHPGHPDVVHAVSADFPRGQLTALLGPNGAGKSSLLKAIVGLIPSRGEILIDGQPLSDLDVRARARTVAYVPQRTRLDALLSVFDVVDQGRFVHRGPFAGPTAADQAAVEAALREVNAQHLADRLFSELSGGEQQKVLIARALATEARTLLLDEPTAALDARHVLVLHHGLRRLAAQGLCVVVVLHGLDEVHRHADQAILLNEGRIHRAGPAQEIVSPGPVHEVYDVEVRPNTALGLYLPKDP